MCEFHRESEHGAEAARPRAITALSHVARLRLPRSAEQVDDPFRVVRGQLTFDAEGAEGGRFHSRRAHWPGGASGVTIGRGYDMRERSAREIVTDLTRAGISEAHAGRLAAASGLSGPHARDWLATHGPSLPEITPAQQKVLFYIAYDRLAADVVRISASYARTLAGRTGRPEAAFQIDWTRVHPAIRDLLVDLRYRGDYRTDTRPRVQPPAIANDVRALYEVIRDRAYWSGLRVPADRIERRVRYLEGVLRVATQGAGGSGQPSGAQAGDTQGGGVPGGGGQAGGVPGGTPATYTVTASAVNVRSAPDASNPANRLGSLPRGARVTGIPTGNGWIQIVFGGRPAFVSALYVTTASTQAEPSRPAAGNAQRSGKHWRGIADASGWSNSTAFSSLDPAWGARAQAFVALLRASGATVEISAGRRHPNRAFLMHYAWGVAHGEYTPAQANQASRARGIAIDWDHGDLATSQAAAQELVAAFSMEARAALDSNHIRGLAIDMTISNLPASVTFDGDTYATRRGASGTAAAESVAPIGQAMGVIWRGSSDFVHWSVNGH
ncbi:MAG TPA: SH3 domain-containing protein [Haliangium sp.]|nr:SH3 domain-containing protein [Haliangium sp.]